MGSRKKPAREGFEALYRRLEETVARLEEGGLTLEESLALYEEGMKLAQGCQELLQQAELKITKLREEFAALGGEPEPYPLGEEEDMPPE
jgi:exodeoxyribonuclease VII small subunit